MEAATARLQRRHHARSSSAEQPEGLSRSPGSMLFQEQRCSAEARRKEPQGLPTQSYSGMDPVCLNSNTLTPELLSCEDKPSKGQPHRFSLQNLTCLKPPSCCFCGFLMEIFPVFSRDRNKQGTWLGSCSRMEQSHSLTQKHGETTASLS